MEQWRGSHSWRLGHLQAPPVTTPNESDVLAGSFRYLGLWYQTYQTSTYRPGLVRSGGLAGRLLRLVMPLPSCPHPAWVAAGLNHFMSDQPDFTRSKWHGATTGFTPYLPLSQPGRLFHRPATLDTRKTPVLVPNAFADRLVHDHNAKCPVMAEVDGLPIFGAELKACCTLWSCRT